MRGGSPSEPVKRAAWIAKISAACTGRIPSNKGKPFESSCATCGKVLMLTGDASYMARKRGRAYCPPPAPCNRVGGGALIAAAQTGRKASQEAKANMSAAQAGRTVNAETRAKMSAITKARMADPVARKLLAAGARARFKDPAARKRLSETHRRRGIRPPLDSRYDGTPTRMEARLAGALPTGWMLHHKIPNGYGRRGSGVWEVDLALPDIRLALEIDGRHHTKSKQMARDARKTAFLRDSGWTVLRFTNDQVRDDLAGCVAAIMAVVESKEAR